MNDERNVRVLFERALSVLPAEESVEVGAPLCSAVLIILATVTSLNVLFFMKSNLKTLRD
jgi:hypothetical protein